MEGAAWPYLVEEPLELGGPSHYTPHQTNQGLSPPNYGPVPYTQGHFPPHQDLPAPNYGPVPHTQGPFPPHQDFPAPNYGPVPHNQGLFPPNYGVPHNQGPIPAHQGPPAPNYGPVPHDQAPLPTHQDFFLPHSSYGHNQDGVFHNGGDVSDLPYQYQEDEWEEYEEEEEEEENFLPYNSLEEALQELDIQLPRLAVTAPPSVIPPKGGGRCRLPNLGSSSYVNAVLQCLYHTPDFPACLSLACEGLEEGQKQKNSIARALTFLMTKMDDVKLMKRGMMAYFKGVCGLRDEAFAGVEQQEAHKLLAGLLLWLHKDLTDGLQDKVDCACTKTSLSKYLASSITRNQASLPGNNPPPGYTIYTGDNHSDTNHHHHPSNSPLKSNDVDGGRERKVCQNCGVTYQRRSFISDMFEGIHQLDVICARAGIILHTNYERFTSLSVPISAPGEATLEEALQQYYGMNMVMWDCEYCSKSHLCHQQIRVLCSPLILAIHLSRPAKKHSAKMQGVNFPTDHLTLADHMIPGRKNRFRCHKYSLYAACNLHGTPVQGHYTAVCKANKDQRQQGHWFLFDDEKVSKTSQFKNTKEAHILFYKSPLVEMMHETDP
ncbi:hypothetical protein O3P69_006647 [Scylla paramamosain]|uniref:ubiquitinyl hydrolase 1 n=1 Tax=Scylla paramamosain TaxID=85552 RepID=A0AAW0U3S6_SCYPA